MLFLFNILVKSQLDQIIFIRFSYCFLSSYLIEPEKESENNMVQTFEHSEAQENPFTFMTYFVQIYKIVEIIIQYLI